MYDYYDYGFPAYYWWYLSYGYFLAILIYGGFFFYVFPFFQSIVQHQNKRWLASTLGRVKDLDPSTKDKILEEAKPEFEEPLYKLTKYQYLVGGIITAIVGLLVAIIHEPDESTVKALIWLPLIVGGITVGLYLNSKKTNRLFKETAGFFGVIGLCVTIPGIFAVYGWDWMRSDLLIYLILAMSLALVHLLESTIASLVYITAVTVGSMLLTVNVGQNWMMFFKSGIWLFALAPLVFWMPRLKSSKEVGVKEIAFGILFMVMMITITLTNLKSLKVVGISVMIPVLYMFSKIHFKQDGWFLTKPIQSLIVLATFYGIVAMNFEEVTTLFPSFKRQFVKFSFHMVVDYGVIIAMVFGGIMMFRDNFEDDLKKVNLIVLGFAPAAYLLSFFADFYVHYLFLIVLAGYGWTYLSTGLQNKNAFTVMLGGMGTLSVLAMIYAKLPKDTWDSQGAIGALVMVYGLAMVGLALYMRSQWTITEDGDEEVSQLPSSPEVLDNQAT